MKRLHFEDIEVGHSLTPLVKGPITTAHAFRWSAAMENWHKIHYDLPFTLEHEKLPGLLIAGSLKQQFVVQLLKDWVSQCFEPAGWVWKISYQFRAMSVVGETLVGAYGVSGGTSDQDEVMARWAREKIGWAHTKRNDDTPQDVKDHINQIYDKVGLGKQKL